MKRNKTVSKYYDVDIERLFDDYDIDYKEHGKNIGRGWYGIETCPFCDVGGYHFGVNKNAKGYSCWACGERGFPPKMLSEMLKIPIQESYEIVRKYIDGEIEIVERVVGGKVQFPTNVVDVDKKGIKYLESRGFNAKEIIDTYKLRQTDMFSSLAVDGMGTSDFKLRLILPIIMNRELVSYTARDYTGQREPKYKHPLIEACKIPASSTIYNIDTVKDKALILEGPTDVWRMGKETVSIQGIKFTKEQIRVLAEKNLKKLVIMFDWNAQDKAEAMAAALYGTAKTIQIAALDKGDAGELSVADAIKIKHQLLYM